MKNLLTQMAAVLVAVIVAAAWVVQKQQLAKERAQLAASRGELEQKSQQIDELDAAQKAAEQQTSELRREKDELAAQLQARQQADAKAAVPAPINPSPTVETNKSAKEPAGFGNMLAKMMQDPDTKKFIRDQQRVMMDQLYAPLVKQMGLSPEEATQFKDLLADNMIKGAEQASSLFDGTAATNHAAATAMVDQQKNLEAQVKEFLGDDRFAQYKDYQETVGERTQLNLFKSQTAGGEGALTDQQTEQLLAFMKEEKKNLAASGQTLPGAGQDGSNVQNLQAMLTGGQTDKWLTTQQALNQRVYERAQTILSPDQLKSFGQFQANQVSMMKVGLNMAQKMFGADKPEAGATPGQ